MSTRPGRGTVLRDALSWALGWAVIFKQAGILFDPPAQTSESLIWMAAVLIGGPGMLHLAALRFGGSPGAGTPGSSPPAPLPESPPSSSGAPARTAEGGA